MPSTQYLIIGAGLSGLVTGYLLKEAGFHDFMILEGRSRPGGRILTETHIDLGATWFQDHHHTLSQWLDKLAIKKFRQYQKGKSVFVYSSMAPPQYFDTGNPENSAFRIVGGSERLIQALYQPIQEHVRLDARVDHIVLNAADVIVKTENLEIRASKVVLALPPQLISYINFHPSLPAQLIQVIHQTHTWMSNAIKVGIAYNSPFWRKQNYSGTIIGHVAPAIEIYDHSDYKNDNFSLMGFVNEGLRGLSPKDRQERIIAHLVKHLGPQAQNFTHYSEKDWSIDPMTSSPHLNSVYISPQYGNPIFLKPYMDGRLYFSGAETASVHGGYMDGAILSGVRVYTSIVSNS